MSKFADALNKIQKQNRKPSQPPQKPLFISPVGTHLRSRSGADKMRTFLRILQPLLALAGIVCVVMIFLYGVREGKKISEAQQQKTSAEVSAVESVSESSAEAGQDTAAPAPQTTDAASAQEPSPASGTEEQAAAPGDGTPSTAAEAGMPAAGTEVSAEPVPAVVSAPAGRYTIQLITYTTPERAAEQAARLKTAGFDPLVIENGFYYQVSVNRFATADEARAFLSSNLSREAFAPYPGAYVRQLPEGME